MMTATEAGEFVRKAIKDDRPARLTAHILKLQNEIRRRDRIMEEANRSLDNLRMKG